GRAGQVRNCGTNLQRAASGEGSMSDELFPSGPWTGFYNYVPGGRRHQMQLDLAFGNGRIFGGGVDDVGHFLIKGRYDAANGECSWTKTYLGAHDVFYRGFREGKGIWGRWEIGALAHGGFHIWPRQTTVEAEQSEAEEAPVSVPVD